MKNSAWAAMAVVGFLVIGACNNSGKGSVDNADSANAAKIDSGTLTLSKDEAKFMVTALNGGMTEVKLGEIAQQKAHSERVKDFGAMMVRDHSSADNKLKSIAEAKNITLPDSLSEDSRKDVENLSKKQGTDFDKAYMKMMLDGHQKTVHAFQDELEDVQNPDLKQWISNTLPTVEMHLDSATSINKVYSNSQRM